LILNEIPSREKFTENAQALDFSGREAYASPAFNKVIHRLVKDSTKRCEIKDLAAVREDHLKLRLPSPR
jgi:hypothetical protein